MVNAKIFLNLAVVLPCIFLQSCSTVQFGGAQSEPILHTLETQDFVALNTLGKPLKGWVRKSLEIGSSREAPPPALVIFESDGADWGAGGFLPPVNPTPRRAVGAEIALALSRDYKGEVIYLARHCQFIGREPPDFDASCRKNTLWTNGRFGASVVRDFLHILSTLPGGDGAAARTNWILTGFSGGGTLAALVATELPGVRCLVTFAAPLDIDAWVDLHGLSPLDRSLNPADRIHALKTITDKAFWFGERDRRVPLLAAGRLLGFKPHGIVKSIDGFTHRADSGWISSAGKLLQLSCPDLRSGFL
jgi:hypothetical protein